MRLLTGDRPRLQGRLADLAVARTAWRQLGRQASLPRWPAPSSETVSRWSPVPAGLSPLIVTVSWLVADTLQPASYSPVRQTVSAMAGQDGTDTWIMTGALLLVGGCYLMTAASLSSVGLSARLLLAVSGACSLGVAASPEPAAGPTPQHLAFTAIGAVALAVWPAFTGRREPRSPLVVSVRGSAIATAVFVAMLGWLILEMRAGRALGAAERLDISAQTWWPFVVALKLRGAAPPRSLSRRALAAASLMTFRRPPAPAPGSREWPAGTARRKSRSAG